MARWSQEGEGTQLWLQFATQFANWLEFGDLIKNVSKMKTNLIWCKSKHWSKSQNLKVEEIWLVNLVFVLVPWVTFWRRSVNMETLVNLLGDHPCIVNIPLGPLTVHYREVLL